MERAEIYFAFAFEVEFRPEIKEKVNLGVTPGTASICMY